MDQSADISWLSLGLGFLLLIIPIIILWFYQTRLVKPTIIAFVRMFIQLFLVGIYLKYIFLWDRWWINLIWVVIMIIAAGLTITKRTELNMKLFVLPVIIGFSANVIINGFFIGFIILGIDNLMKAQYMIPIYGMLIGNSIGSTIVGLRSLYNGLSKEEERYRYTIMCGATEGEAIFSFVSEALKSALNPIIANTATIGLIWLPGMMTGQILAGSQPMTAIKYQVMIIVTIFVASVISLYLSIITSQKVAFDEFSIFSKNIIFNKSIEK